MFHQKARFYLTGLFIILAVILHIELGFGSAWYLYLAALLMALTHLMFGNVWAAFVKLRKGKIDEAEILLNDIKRPEWLTKRHKAYYHFVRGMIALQRKELPTGEQHLKKAIDIGLRTDNDNALAALNLAHIFYVDGRPEEADTYVRKAKSYSSNDLMIKENINKLEKALSRMPRQNQAS